MENTPIAVNIEDLREVGDFSGCSHADLPIGHGVHATIVVHRLAMCSERADADWTLIGQDTHSSSVVHRPAMRRGGKRADANWIVIKGE